MVEAVAKMYDNIDLTSYATNLLVFDKIFTLGFIQN